jgi:2-polyprenyl-6-methoxyphenol hydroxylase-like FAD-dependent oxidoreductase
MLPAIDGSPRRGRPRVVPSAQAPGYRSRDMSDGGETVPRADGTVHVVGAGPVGSFMTALLQTIPGQRVLVYEKRSEYTRTRMVQLAPYLVADSIESYLADQLDGQNVAAIFDPVELEYRMAYRRRVAPDLRALLDEWTVGFVPINTIERSLTTLIETRGTGTVERVAGEITMDGILERAERGDIVVDTSGTRSVFRDALVPGGEQAPLPNTQLVRLEYALVVTFLYSGHYACNEYCKYYKNIENSAYKFIPGVKRTVYDGEISHVTGIVGISEDEFHAMPRSFDGAWLREHFPAVAESMDRFIDKMQAESHGEVVGDIEVVRIPLDVFHAYNATSRLWHRAGGTHPLATTPVFLLGDAAIGSPYFQSISMGFENAFFLAGHIENRNLPMTEVLDRYEAFMYRQWLRVYMRTTMIKHNKDLLQSVGDTFGLLEKLDVY